VFNWEEMSINEIVELAKQGNRSAYHYIFKKYKGIIHSTIKKKNYFLQGGDYDDLFQEGLIGLYKAIRDFDKTHGEFDVFCKICIDRQLISAIKTSTRRKHAPLNDMIPFDRTLPENDNLTMMDIFGAKEDVQYTISFETLDPEKQLLLKEMNEMNRKKLEEILSEKEKAVYYLYLEDKSYKEIMESLNIQNPKTIDNALQRVKRKIEKIKNEDLIQKNSQKK